MMVEKPETEDVLIYRGTRKTKLNIEDEFMHDMQSMLLFEQAKLRRFEGISKFREDNFGSSNQVMIA